MKESEEYGWRLTPGPKRRLAARAQEEHTSIAELPERIVGAWLRRRRDEDDNWHQREFHEAATPCLGAIAGGDPGRSRRVRDRVRAKLGVRRQPRTP
jgi:hypothetical protein